MNATTERQSKVLLDMILKNLEEQTTIYKATNRYLGTVYAPSGISRLSSPDIYWAYEMDISPTGAIDLADIPCGQLCRVRQINNTHIDRSQGGLHIIVGVDLYTTTYPKWGALSEVHQTCITFRYEYSGSAWNLDGVSIGRVSSMRSPSTNQANGLSI
jgi:hypothetical protein